MTARWKRKLLMPRDWYRQAHWFIKRGRRGWSPHDLWSMDDYICTLLGQMAAELRRTSHGHPCLGEPDCSMPESEQCDCEQRWNETLDKISAPLLAYKSRWDWPDSMDFVQHGELESKLIAGAQDALRLMADNLSGLWD